MTVGAVGGFHVSTFKVWRFKLKLISLIYHLNFSLTLSRRERVHFIDTLSIHYQHVIDTLSISYRNFIGTLS